MRVYDAILAALAVLPMAGCGSSSSCEDFDSEAEPFELTDWSFGEDVFLQTHNQDIDYHCYELCADGLRDTDQYPNSGKQLVVDSCTFDWDEVALQGSVSCEGDLAYMCLGRRPAGWIRRGGVGPTALAKALVRFAIEERAAAIAFDQLADRLTAWGAPDELIARCRIAADQERRHHTLMRLEAEARGGIVPDEVSEDRLPDRIDLAVLNATDGCVNEAAMALVAHVLSDRAPTESLRRAFAEIARDETEHAELSWDLHAWFQTSAPSDRPDLALVAAIDALPDALERYGAELPPELGLPPLEHAARALAAGLAA